MRDKNVKKFNCYQVKTKINDFISYNLSSKEALALAEHCEECKDCMDELKLTLIVNEFMSDKDIYDIDEFAENEIEKRFLEVSQRVSFLDMMNRNMKYFVIGATIFLILSLLIEILI